MTGASLAGVAAAALQALAYGIYVVQMLRGMCRPNAMSWLMWTLGTGVVLGIEWHLGVPASVLLLPAICFLCSLGVVAHGVLAGGHLEAERQDWLALALHLGLLGTYVALARSGEAAAGWAPLLLGVSGAGVLVSTWPILRTTCRAPQNERPLAWFVWSAAYGLLALAVMREGLSWPYLVYPLTCQVLHLMIGIVALDSGDSAVQDEAIFPVDLRVSGEKLDFPDR